MTILDMNVFNNLKDSTGADFILELLSAFFEDAENQMEQMRTSMATQDVETFRRAAHSLKSNAATFGAMELSSLARELETMARNENLEAGNRLEDLKDAFEKVKIMLNELR
ncbi:MAG: Hpt domain-containing protein [Anaerolineales bacterium]|nr:Hpt domain-containing protein [Anaerolineales bacterium]MCB9146667.1 Hpt domain-containing protein [Anaerolineales bacterium]